MEIYFKKGNCNCLVFEKNNKKYYVAIPPSKNCIDVFDPSGITKAKHVFGEHYYLHSIDAYVIITNNKERFVYKNGKLVCKTILTN